MRAKTFNSEEFLYQKVDIPLSLKNKKIKQALFFKRNSFNLLQFFELRGVRILHCILTPGRSGLDKSITDVVISPLDLFIR